MQLFEAIFSIFQFAIMHLIGLGVGLHSRLKKCVEHFQLLNIFFQDAHVGHENLGETFFQGFIGFGFIGQANAIGPSCCLNS